MKITVMMLSVFYCLLLLAPPALAGDINLFAAASLKEVITELSGSFTRKHPGAKFIKNFGASGQLAKQIENGAPADIFISANREWMDYLKERRLVNVASVATFTHNSLVFVGMPGRVSSLRDLGTLQRVAIGSPRSVPAGGYAMDAIRKSRLDRSLEKKLVMAKDVRECLMYAERGEVDGAFVYKTDALQAKKTKILFSVPQELYPPGTYPMSLTVPGASNRDAAAFFAYLRSDEARGVLARYGFAPR